MFMTSRKMIIIFEYRLRFLDTMADRQINIPDAKLERIAMMLKKTEFQDICV